MIGRHHLVLLLAAALSAAAQGKAPAAKSPRLSPDLSRDRAAALAAYDAGNTAVATPALERLAERLPHDFAVQEALGLLQADAGDSAAALPHLKAAARAEPRNPPAQANLGAALLELKSYPEAVVALRAAAQLDPGKADTEANLGHALFLDHQPRPAAEALARASQLDPGNLDLVYDRALALDAAGLSSQALPVLAAIPPSKRSAAIESLWGDIAEHAGQFQQSEEHMQRAANLEPTEPYLYNLAVELLRHWTWEPALRIADFGLTRFPDSRRLALARGISLYGNTHYAEAATVFATLLRLEPDNTTYGDLLGRSCAALDAGAPDCSLLIQFANAHPANGPIALFAAISILHQPDSSADLAAAEHLLQQATAHNPASPEPWYQLGVLQQRRQQWAQSELSLRKAVELRPAYAEAHYRLSRAYARTGQPDLARAEIALQQRYAQQEKEASDARNKEVTIFITKPQ